MDTCLYVSMLVTYEMNVYFQRIMPLWSAVEPQWHKGGIRERMGGERGRSGGDWRTDGDLSLQIGSMEMFPNRM